MKGDTEWRLVFLSSTICFLVTLRMSLAASIWRCSPSLRLMSDCIAAVDTKVTQAEPSALPNAPNIGR